MDNLFKLSPPLQLFNFSTGYGSENDLELDIPLEPTFLSELEIHDMISSDHCKFVDKASKMCKNLEKQKEMIIAMSKTVKSARITEIVTQNRKNVIIFGSGLVITSKMVNSFFKVGEMLKRYMLLNRNNIVCYSDLSDIFLSQELLKDRQNKNNNKLSLMNILQNVYVSVSDLTLLLILKIMTYIKERKVQEIKENEKEAIQKILKSMTSIMGPIVSSEVDIKYLADFFISECFPKGINEEITHTFGRISQIIQEITLLSVENRKENVDKINRLLLKSRVCIFLICCSQKFTVGMVKKWLGIEIVWTKIVSPGSFFLKTMKDNHTSVEIKKFDYSNHDSQKIKRFYKFVNMFGDTMFNEPERYEDMMKKIDSYFHQSVCYSELIIEDENEKTNNFSDFKYIFKNNNKLKDWFVKYWKKTAQKAHKCKVKMLSEIPSINPKKKKMGCNFLKDDICTFEGLVRDSFIIVVLKMYFISSGLDKYVDEKFINISMTPEKNDLNKTKILKLTPTSYYLVEKNDNFYVLRGNVENLATCVVAWLSKQNNHPDITSSTIYKHVIENEQ